MTPVPPAPPGMPRGFAPREVGLDQFLSLLQETATVLAAAPQRLCALFMMVYLPVQFLTGIPYAAKPLRLAVLTVGLTGFFVALEAARAGRLPGLADMLVPWRLPADKLILLVASGLFPLVCVLLLWWFDLGWDTVDRFLEGAPPPAEGMPLRQAIELELAFNLSGLPLLFIQPLCVLHSWSGTRSLSASLLAVAANWRWALALALLGIPIDVVLLSLGQGVAEEVLSLLAAGFIQIGMSAFTLVLLQRSLR